MSSLEEYLNRPIESFFGITRGMKRLLSESGVQTVKDLLENFNLDDVASNTQRLALQRFKETRLKETERFHSEKVAVTKLPSLPKEKKSTQSKKNKTATSKSPKVSFTNSFYVGGAWSGGLAPSPDVDLDPIQVPWADLLRHTFICGGTGSGKTVLVKSLLEQAAVNGIPSVVIDPAGDYVFLALAEALKDEQSLANYSESYAKNYGPENSFEKSTKYWLEAFLEDQKQNHLGGVTLPEIKGYKKNTFVRIFAPGSSRQGTPLALPPIDGHLLQRDAAEEEEDYIKRVDEIVLTMVKTLGVRPRNQDRFATFLREIINTGANAGDFEGRSGDRFLERLTQLLPRYSEVLRDIGGVPIEDFITKAEVNSLARELATYRKGTKASWLKGIPFDLDTLTTQTEGRVPINIICIQHLDPREQQDAVARIASKIGRWMFGGKNSASSRPRLLFSLDELGGGGSTDAIFPPIANPVSKPPLLRLIRQGRKYGIGLILATQNVKDIDYKGLGNVNSWFVGKLTQQREFKIIQDALTNSVSIGANINPNQINHIIPGLKEGMFLYLGSSGEGKRLKARWIKSLHLRPSQELQEKLVNKQRKAVDEHVNALVFSKTPFVPSLEYSLFENYRECLLARLLKIEEIKLGEFEAFKWLVDVSKSAEAVKNILPIIKKIKLKKQNPVREWLLHNKRIAKEIIADALECLATQSLKNGNYEEAAATIKTETNQPRKKSLLNFIKRIANWSLLGEQIHGWKSIDDKIIIEIKDNGFAVDPFDQTKVNGLIKSVKSNIHKKIQDTGQKQLTKWLEEVKKKRGLKAKSSAPKARHGEKLIDQRTLVNQVIKNIRDGGKIDASKLGLLDWTTKTLKDIDPEDFEYFVAKILNERGYATELTRQVGDDGVDVLAYDKSQRRIAIQCKRYEKPVGSPIIREMKGAQKLNKCDASLVVTTSRFTSAARRTAGQLNVGLIDGNNIVQILI